MRSGDEVSPRAELPGTKDGGGAFKGLNTPEKCPQFVGLPQMCGN